MMFRNGFLYHEFRISKLVIEDVCPMLDEIRKFQVDMNLQYDNAAFESDLDEWDLMKDSTVLKTSWNEKRLKIQVGDRCKVIEG
jgi:transcription elongation factor